MPCSVRRDEVQSPASSRSPSPVDDTDIQDAHARLGKLLDLDGLIGSTTTYEETKESIAPAAGNAEDEEQEFEFRLFSAPAKSKDTTTSTQKPASGDKPKNEPERTNKDDATQKLRIRLRSPTPNTDPSEGRFVRAFRGWQYYFTTPSLFGLGENSKAEELQAERRRQFEDMAVSGTHMAQWAKSQAWVSQFPLWIPCSIANVRCSLQPGCHLPWRVIHLKRHQTKLPPKSKDVPIYVVEGAPSSKSPKTRKKPGKKRRVQLRKRAETAKAAQETEAEKRNRKNRERKIKRRQKAREQKAASATGGDVSLADVDGASSGADE